MDLPLIPGRAGYSFKFSLHGRLSFDQVTLSLLPAAIQLKPHALRLTVSEGCCWRSRPFSIRRPSITGPPSPLLPAEEMLALVPPPLACGAPHRRSPRPGRGACCSSLREIRQAPELLRSLPEIREAKRVVLVRHGQSTWNEEGRIQGSSDLSVLTPKGESQAETSRQMLLTDSFDVCFTRSVHYS